MVDYKSNKTEGKILIKTQYHYISFDVKHQHVVFSQKYKIRYDNIK